MRKITTTKPSGISTLLNLDANDDLSQRELSSALNTIAKKLKVNNKYDIPYLAGYSKNGKIIYIDKNIPKYFTYKDKKVNIYRFLILHEIVEKTLIEHLGRINYKLAHQIATRSEKAAVEGEGISWKEYNAFVQEYVQALRKEKNYQTPKDLDLKPYKDEKDKVILKRIAKR